MGRGGMALSGEPLGSASRDERPQGIGARLSITGLEADLAYFHARLELIGSPTTINQRAQLAAFQLLVQSFTRILQRLRRRAVDAP
jgi:hypothetical protein